MQQSMVFERRVSEEMCRVLRVVLCGQPGPLIASVFLMTVRAAAIIGSTSLLYQLILAMGTGESEPVNASAVYQLALAINSNESGAPNLTDLDLYLNGGSGESGWQPEIVTWLVGYVLLRWLSRIIQPLQDLVLEKRANQLSLNLTDSIMFSYFNQSKEMMQQKGTFAKILHYFAIGFQFLRELYVNDLVGKVIASAVEIVALLIGIALVSPELVGLYAATVAVCVMVLFVLAKYHSAPLAYNKLWKENKSFQELIAQLFIWETAHDCGRLETEYERAKAWAKELARDTIRQDNAVAGIDVVTITAYELGFAVTFWYAIHLISQGMMGGLDLILVAVYLTETASSLQLLARSVVEIMANYQNFREIMGFILNVRDQSSTDGEDLVVAGPGARVVFEGVSFRHKSTGAGLEGVNLVAEPGTFKLVRGESGSGKSTLMDLLMKYYEPDEGSVTVNGVPISSVSQASLLKQIAVVPQAPVMSQDPVAGNIVYAREGASDEAVIAAARSAGLSGLVDGGRMGDSAADLSGGQQRRVGIARALLQDTPIYLLDEPFVGIHGNLAEEIAKHMLGLIAQGKTVIVVSHKPTAFFVELMREIGIAFDPEAQVFEIGAYSCQPERRRPVRVLEQEQGGDTKKRDLEMGGGL